MSPGLPPLRRAGPADAAAVRALTLAAYAKWVPVIGREPRPMTADYDEAVRAHRIDMMHDGDRLIGLIELVIRQADILIENLAVDPGAQGRGIGGALLDHAERVAAAEGRPTIRLYTNARMATNLAFYAARGFAVEREEPWGTGLVIHMAKATAAPAR